MFVLFFLEKLFLLFFCLLGRINQKSFSLSFLVGCMCVTIFVRIKSSILSRGIFNSYPSYVCIIGIDHASNCIQAKSWEISKSFFFRNSIEIMEFSIDICPFGVYRPFFFGFYVDTREYRKKNVHPLFIVVLALASVCLFLLYTFCLSSFQYSISSSKLCFFIHFRLF